MRSVRSPVFQFIGDRYKLKFWRRLFHGPLDNRFSHNLGDSFIQSVGEDIFLIQLVFTD